jgi:hypothetical protein
MRVMVLVKASETSEAGQFPSTELIAAMSAFNEELVEAGVLLAADGLKPSSQGARIQFDADGSRTVVDGPFAETKELLSGFWVWQVDSLDHAIEWARKIPSAHGETGNFEIRPCFELDDFADQLTPELREKQDDLRSRLEAQQS